MKQEKEALVFEQGAQFGYAQAVSQIFLGVNNCQQVPLAVDNQTVNLINSECIDLVTNPAN